MTAFNTTRTLRRMFNGAAYVDRAARFVLAKFLTLAFTPGPFIEPGPGSNCPGRIFWPGRSALASRFLAFCAAFAFARWRALALVMSYEASICVKFATCTLFRSHFANPLGSCSRGKSSCGSPLSQTPSCTSGTFAFSIQFAKAGSCIHLWWSFPKACPFHSVGRPTTNHRVTGFHEGYHMPSST